MKGMDQDILYGCNEAQSGLGGFAVYAQDPAFPVEMVEQEGIEPPTQRL